MSLDLRKYFWIGVAIIGLLLVVLGLVGEELTYKLIFLICGAILFLYGLWQVLGILIEEWFNRE